MLTWILYEAIAPNGRRYIGVTGRTLPRRVSSHKHAARNGSPLRFHAALRKYGNAIEFRTLVIGQRAYVIDLEVKAIEAFNTCKRAYGYNSALGGESPMLTPEIARRAGLPKKGRKQSEAHVAAVKAARRDPDVRARMSDNRKGKGKWTEEQRAKHIAKQTGSRHSLETRAKMSASMTGLKRTPEGCANISAAKKGVKRVENPLTSAERAKRWRRRHPEEAKARDKRQNDRRALKNRASQLAAQSMHPIRAPV